LGEEEQKSVTKTDVRDWEETKLDVRLVWQSRSGSPRKSTVVPHFFVHWVRSGYNKHSEHLSKGKQFQKEVH
jgi:hypothetical protein